MNRAKSMKFFEDILSAALKKQASDIHLKAGIIPVIRKHGKLRPLSSNAPTISNERLEQMLLSIINEKQQEQFDEKKYVDIAYQLPNQGHFRVNAFLERGNLRLVIRVIPSNIPRLPELNLPSIVERFPNLERGLILVTGATGSGKSTALASIVDHINRTRNTHIITVEDPIEFRIKDRKSLVSQIEVGTDTQSFAEALRASLRQDPNVLLIGEMRDRETIEMALTAAETGHLVLSTLHTSDTMETINRILSSFPPHQHQQLRNQLASTLKAIMGIRLIERKDKEGFIPATEIMINNPRIAELITDPARTQEIESVIAESHNSWQMQTFDQSLHELVNNGLITMEKALQTATNPENFKLKRSGITSQSSKNKKNAHHKDEWGEHSEWGKVKELEIEPATSTSLSLEEDDDDGKLFSRRLKKLAK